MRLLELFAGCGGSALGLEAAGFFHTACLESNPDACETLRENGFPAVEMDIQKTWPTFAGKARLDAIWASPPCQPFSRAGGRNVQDKRNLWPATLRVIQAADPRWFMFENVPGLLDHRSKCERGCLGPEKCPRAYFDRVILQQLKSLFQVVQWRILCASSYGLPQRRRRVFIVAGESRIRWPQATHGKPTTQGDLFGRTLLPWRTPDYWHRPSPTVSALGEYKGSGPGGNPEKMQRASDALYLATGRRRLSAEELAALQGFPEAHRFKSSTKRSLYAQIGNAVPPKLAEVVGRAVLQADLG